MMFAGKYIVKSGTDFRQFSKIILTFTAEGPVDVTIEEVNITSKYDEDEDLLQELKKYDAVVQGETKFSYIKFYCLDTKKYQRY